MKRIIILFLWLLGVLVNAQTNYYVSPTGNNGGTGAIGDPWLTIVYGESQMTGGDTLYVRTGIYNEKITISGVNGTSGARTYISSYKGERAIIDGTGVPVSASAALVTISSNYVTFNNFIVRNVNRSSLVNGYGINETGTNVLIKSCTLYDIAGGGIGIGGDSTIAEYDTLYNIALLNNRDSGRVSATWPAVLSARRYPAYAIIRHCVVHDSWGEGISTFEATHTTIEDNKIYNIYSAMLYVSDATDVLVQRNFIYQTRVIGVNSAICIANEGHTPITANTTVINNIVYGCYRNLRTGNGTPLINTLIANNTFVNGISGTVPYNVQIGNITHSNSYFANNIIIQDDAMALILAYPPVGLTFEYNLWSKTHDTDATGTGDIISTDNIARVGIYTDVTYYALTGTTGALDGGKAIGINTDYLSAVRSAIPDNGALEGTPPAPPVLASVLTSLTYYTWTRAALSGGSVIDDGGGAVTAYGIAYGTSTAPTILGNHTHDGTGTGVYTSTITGLVANTTYYVRAYATNSVGTSYGSEVSFMTPPYAVVGNGAGKIYNYTGKIVIIK